MSDSKELASTSSDIKSDDSQSQFTDPELDIRSEYFNPLKALLSPELHLPIKDAPLYNNIAHYESAMKRQQTGSETRQAAPKMPQKSYREEVELHTRRFLPHQGMVRGKGKRARQTRNILTKMNDGFEGPLNALNQWKIQQKRVKIFTRNATTINGHATGFIEALDKHWNIVLRDVFEVWHRKKFHYCPKAVMLHHGNHDDGDGDVDEDKHFAECMQRLQMLNITIPTVNAKSLNRRQAECSRNVPKLLIRGEQIATIILDTPNNETGNGNKIQPK